VCVFCNKQWGDYHDISVEKDVIVTDYGETFVDIPIRNEIFEISNVTIDLKYRSIAVKLITQHITIHTHELFILYFVKYLPCGKRLQTNEMGFNEICTLCLVLMFCLVGKPEETICMM